MTESRKKLFCFGYGYTCDYLGHELLSRGWQVAGTTRDSEKRDDLRARGVDAHIFDFSCPLPDPLFVLDGVTHLVISTPPGDEGDPAFLMHAQDILNIPTLEWVGYLSTTGVYGDRDGDWVDENSEIRPNSQRGSRRVMAEEQWQSLVKGHDLPVHYFRLAGIYGPGRSALDTIRAGVARRIEKPGHAFSRIHVEDIVQVLIASMERHNAGAAYNVCDDLAAPSHEVIAHACDMLGRPIPPLIPIEDADLSPMARSFYNDNKRVKNARIKDELGVALKYTNYIDGLQGCMDAEEYALKLFKL
ncbi:MAG: SDR family oxidoreductase [Alphaproteobacteria bacterium]